MTDPVRPAARAAGLHASSGDTPKAVVGREHLAEALDHFAIGVIFVDETGRVMGTNRSAMEILRQRDGLSVGEDRSLAAVPEGQGSLEALIRRARESMARGRRHCAAVALIPRHKSKHPLHLCVAPLTSPGAPSLLAVFVSDHRKPNASGSKWLGRFYGLTPAEARLAMALVRGNTLQQACKAAGISTNTARFHLKHIFAKTATNRQGELISLLCRGLAMLELDL